MFKCDNLEKQLMSYVPYKLYFRLYYDVWYIHIHIIILLFKCSLWTDIDISWLQHCTILWGVGSTLRNVTCNSSVIKNCYSCSEFFTGFSSPTLKVKTLLWSLSVFGCCLLFTLFHLLYFFSAYCLPLFIYPCETS